MSRRKGWYGPLEDRMYVTYTDIRDTLAEIARAHKTAKPRKERRTPRQSVTRKWAR